MKDATLVDVCSVCGFALRYVRSSPNIGDIGWHHLTDYWLYAGFSSHLPDPARIC